MALVIGAGVVALVAANDVGVHDQLRSNRTTLATTEGQLKASNIQVQIDAARLRESRSQIEVDQATQQSMKTSFQSAMNIIQNATTSPTSVIVNLPRVQGVVATIILSPSSSRPSEFSLTTVINGAAPGITYSIAAGPCPEDLATQSFAASAVAGVGGIVVLPPVRVEMPNNGPHYWIRLHLITPPTVSQSGVLGGILGPFSSGKGAPIPPNMQAC